jgi:hypothetical protein
MTTPHLSYWSVRTNNWTFNNTKIRAWVESKLQGRTLNACSGVCQLDHDDEIVRNDIQETVTLDKARTINGTDYDAGETVSTNTDVNVPVEDLLTVFPENSFDTIVYDPPFSPNQAEQTYGLDGVDASSDIPIPETLDHLLKPGGRILFFGFTSTVMPDEYAYSMEDIALWNLFGGQFDWLSAELRKPEAPTGEVERTSPGSDVLFSVSDDVLPNTDADQFPEVTGATGGNDGNPISLTYHRYPDGTDLREKAYDLINDELSGRTLSLTHADPGFTHDSPVVTNSLDRAPDADTYFAPQRISDEFADELFNTVVVDPSPEAFQHQLDYYGSKNVEVSILKYESHPLLETSGRIIQLGHMATCMNATLPYIRDDIVILSAADAPRDYIITIDAKQPEYNGAQWTVDSVRETISKSHDRHAESCPACDSEIIGDGYCLQCGADVGTEHVCTTCGEGSYLHPVWYVDCIECGAAPDNYCVDPESGEILREPHQARIEWYEEKHENCGDDSKGIREPPVSLIEPEETDTAQASLAGFNAD